MPRDPHIFYKVVHDENSLSELLCNLFQFSAFRSLFVDLLGRKLGFQLEFDYDHVRTQDDLLSNGRPDISIRTEDCLVFIENKSESYRALTQNQPQSYLRCLQMSAKVKHRGLVFIVPSDYEYLEELEHRARQYNGHRKAHGCAFTILFWEDILQSLLESGLADINPIFNHFAGLLTSWFSTETIVFSEGEIHMLYGKDMPALYMKLTALIDGAKEKLSRTYKIAGEINEFGHGFYVKDRGEPIAWVGVWYEYWKSSGSPLCVAIQDTWRPSVVRRFQSKLSNTVFPSGAEKWYIYGFAPEYWDKSDAIRKLAHDLNEMIEQLRK